MFWIVTAVWNQFSFLTQFLFSWIPFYISLLFQLWMVLPNTRGAITIYTIAFQPVLDQLIGSGKVMGRELAM